MDFRFENPQLLLFGFVVAVMLIVYLAYVFLVQRRFFTKTSHQLWSFGLGASFVKVGYGMLAFSLLSPGDAVNTNPPGADVEPIVLDSDGNPVVVVTTTGTKKGKILKDNNGKKSMIRVDYLDADQKVLSSHEAELGGHLDQDKSYVLTNSGVGKPPAGTASINTNWTFWIERNELGELDSKIGVLSRNHRTLLSTYRTQQLKASRQTSGALDVTLALYSQLTASELAARLKGYVTVSAIDDDGNALTTIEYPAQSLVISAGADQTLLADIKGLSTSSLDPALKWHVVMETRFDPTSGASFMIAQAESAILDP